MGHSSGERGQGNKDCLKSSRRCVTQRLVLSVYSVSPMYAQQPHVSNMLVKSTTCSNARFIKSLTDRNTCKKGKLTLFFLFMPSCQVVNLCVNYISYI